MPEEDDHTHNNDAEQSTSTPLVPSTSTSLPDSLINPTASLHYWTSTPATLSGITGGYPQISLIDLRGSKSFLNKLRRLHPPSTASATTTLGNPNRQKQERHRSPTGQFTSSSSSSGVATRKRLKLGLDAGAGIGRVTDGLLREVCEAVDAVEPVAKFVDVLKHQSKTATEGRLGEVFEVGLESWPPEEAEPRAEADGRKKEKKTYSLIWNQWCLGHLTDVQLVGYLSRCARHLAPPADAGWIVVKENLSTHPQDEDIYDELDSSVTRTDAKFRALFEQAGLSVVRTELQTGFPKGLGLFPVRMYALRPRKWAEGEGAGDTW